MTHDPRGLLLILSSPSGAGKSTLAAMLMAWDPTMRFSVSATTRRPGRARRTAANTISAAAPSSRRWSRRRDAGTCRGLRQFLRLARAARSKRRWKEGRDTVFDIDWQGGQQIRNSGAARDVVSIFILPPSIAELERRLRSRAQDSDEVIAGRMAKSRTRSAIGRNMTMCWSTTTSRQTFDRLKTILRRAPAPRPPAGLSAFVRGLNEEFEAR
jgi:guanylate kinase